MTLVLILLALIAFIVLSTTRLKLHLFLALLAAALIAGFAYQVPTAEIVKTVTGGFGSILGYIGIVIVLGTIIGVILEAQRCGDHHGGKRDPPARRTLPDPDHVDHRLPGVDPGVLRFRLRHPQLAEERPGGADEDIHHRHERGPGHRSLRHPHLRAADPGTDRRGRQPRPGRQPWPGDRGRPGGRLRHRDGRHVVGQSLRRQGHSLVDDGQVVQTEEDFSELRARYGKLPSATQAFAPIFVPILLICLGSVAVFPEQAAGRGVLFACLNFLGQPVIALLVGLALACTLLKGQSKREEFHERVVEGIQSAAPILLITGAGGAFGAMLKITPLGDYLGSTLSALGIGLFMPFVVAAALKTAQGSTTVALVTTSALVAPLLPQLGLDSEMGRVLTVMAIGAGAMTVSHANDSFFWVVTQFSRMTVSTAYRAQTLATLVQGIAGMLAVWLLSLVLL